LRGAAHELPQIPRRPARLLRQLEGGSTARRRVTKGDGVVCGELLERRRRAAARRLQRRDRVLVLAAETKRRAARGKHGQSCRGEQLRHERRPGAGAEVVEQQQDAPVAQVSAM
jgi:hypothetical protein